MNTRFDFMNVFDDQSVPCGVMGSCDGLRSDWWI